MRVYLAGPITGLTMEQSLAWRRKVAAALPPRIGILDPLRYPDEIWDGTRKMTGVNFHTIVRRNKFDVRHCDIVFAYFPDDQVDQETGEPFEDLSVGTIAEMAWGHLLGKGVICVCSERNQHHHPYLLNIADQVFSDLDSGVKYLLHQLDEVQSINFGEIE